MSTSPRTGRRAFPSTLLDADAPIDAYTARDVVFNNALHMADEAGGVWVNWVCVRDAISSKAGAEYGVGDILGASEWNRLMSFGPVNLTLFDDYTPYQLRCALLGADAAGAGADYAEFAIVIGDFYGSRAYVDGTGPSILFAQTTSATPAWLAASTPASDLITLERRHIDPRLVRRATLDDTGGLAVEVVTCEVWVNVWARATGAAVPALYGLHVAEYLAP